MLESYAISRDALTLLKQLSILTSISEPLFPPRQRGINRKTGSEFAPFGWVDYTPSERTHQQVVFPQGLNLESVRRSPECTNVLAGRQAKLKCDATDTKSASNGISRTTTFFQENSLSLTRDRTSPKNGAALRTNVGRMDLILSTLSLLVCQLSISRAPIRATATLLPFSVANASYRPRRWRD
jgi:hypothetical protein